MTEPAYLGVLADYSLPDWIGLVALAKLMLPEIPDGTVYHLAEGDPLPLPFAVVDKLRIDAATGELKADLRTFHAYGDPDEPLVTEWFIHRDDARAYFCALGIEIDQQSPIGQWFNTTSDGDNEEENK